MHHSRRRRPPTRTLPTPKRRHQLTRRESQKQCAARLRSNPRPPLISAHPGRRHPRRHPSQRPRCLRQHRRPRHPFSLECPARELLPPLPGRRPAKQHPLPAPHERTDQRTRRRRRPRRPRQTPRSGASPPWSRRPRHPRRIWRRQPANLWRFRERQWRQQTSLRAPPPQRKRWPCPSRRRQPKPHRRNPRRQPRVSARRRSRGPPWAHRPPPRPAL